MLDTLGTDDRKRYMHHYNMPPYSNGETGRVGSPKRREIGHGLLAERALLPVVPSQDEFPYALRLVSEVLASNGSTSMASVCASTPVADGRRRADQGAGRPASPWASSTPRASTRPSPTSSAPRTPSATWTSRSPARPSSSPPCSSTPRSTACPPTCWPRRCSRPTRPALRSSRSCTRPSPSPARRGGRDRPEDRQLRDPDGQDRRGHRAQGQGHQRHQQETGADISVDDDGMVGTRDDRLDRQGCGRRGQAPDRADPQPAHRRGRARSTRAGS